MVLSMGDTEGLSEGTTIKPNLEDEKRPGSQRPGGPLDIGFTPSSLGGLGPPPV